MSICKGLVVLGLWALGFGRSGRALGYLYIRVRAHGPKFRPLPIALGPTCQLPTANRLLPSACRAMDQRAKRAKDPTAKSKEQRAFGPSLWPNYKEQRAKDKKHILYRHKLSPKTKSQGQKEKKPLSQTFFHSLRLYISRLYTGQKKKDKVF